jgi:uncharacterized protein (TIGR02145 family)
MSGSERDALTNPTAGLMIWCNNCGSNGEIQVYNGTSWTNMTGETTEIACGFENLVDPRDGKSYSTVQIGSQCWMAENLNIGTRVDGSEDMTDNNTIEKYCYDDYEINCNIWGGLYQWDEMMQYVSTEGVQGICPAGWHIPTDTEWSTLTDYLGGEDFAGGKMKESGTVHWNEPNVGATNESGFTALPGGFYGGGYSYLGSVGYWWSCTQINSAAFTRQLYYSNVFVYRNDQEWYRGLSVRCLRD